MKKKREKSLKIQPTVHELASFSYGATCLIWIRIPAVLHVQLCTLKCEAKNEMCTCGQLNSQGLPRRWRELPAKCGHTLWGNLPPPTTKESSQLCSCVAQDETHQAKAVARCQLGLETRAGFSLNSKQSVLKIAIFSILCSNFWQNRLCPDQPIGCPKDTQRP